MEFSAMVRDKLEDDCLYCPYYELRKYAVPGTGKKNSLAMLIGEAPGKDEDEGGRPFIGRSGQLLKEMFEKEGFNESDFWITNIVKCRPIENEYPDVRAVNMCRGLLHMEIEDIVEPKIIIPIGRLATSVLMTDYHGCSMGYHHGKVYRDKEFHNHRYTIIPSYHPAFFLRNPYQKEKMRVPFKLLRDELGYGPELEMEDELERPRR